MLHNERNQLDIWCNLIRSLVISSLDVARAINTRTTFRWFLMDASGQPFCGQHYSKSATTPNYNSKKRYAEEEVKLHAFLTSALEMSDQFQAPSDSLHDECPGTHLIEGWMYPELSECGGQKISSPVKNRTPTVQPVASHLSESATLLLKLFHNVVAQNSSLHDVWFRN